MKTSNNQIPPCASLVAARNELGFLHSASALIDTQATPLELYCQMTAATPAWLKGAFRLRDSISQHFHVERIGGVSGVTPPCAPGGGGKLDFFPIETDPKSAVEGKRVDLRGGRILKKKKTTHN